MNKKSLLFVFFPLITFVHLSYTQSLLPIGTGVFKPDQSDPSYRLYFTDKLETAHLITSEGRYLHTWSYQQGTPWKYAELQPNGSLRVLLWNKKVFELDWESRFVKKKKFITAFSFARKAKRLVQIMPNGNSMITDWRNGRMAEMTPRGKLVWEYLNPDLDVNGNRMQSYRVLPVNPQEAAIPLRAHGLPEDLTGTEKVRMHLKFETQVQLSETLTSVMALIEARYLDDAFRTIRQILHEYPDDPEALYLLTFIYAQRRDFPKAVQAMDKAVRQGIPISRFQLTDPVLAKPLFESKPYQYLLSQNETKLLAHGPRLENLTATYTDITLQTTDTANIAIKVREPDYDRIVTQTASYPMESRMKYRRTFRLSKLSPDTDYVYELWVNGQKQRGEYQFHTYPQRYKASRFQLAFGGETPYLPLSEGIWDTLAARRFSAFLFLGNSLYLDFPRRPATLFYGYDKRSSRPEYQDFISQTCTYHIIGERDFGYQGPLSIADSLPKTAYYTFPIGDVDFFMLDNWSFRSEEGNQGVLGKKQVRWLLRQLENSSATFKIIASSIPWSSGDHPEGSGSFDIDRREIFDFITQNKIEGVLLLSGGRRRSDAWRISRSDAYSLYEFSSGHLSHPLPDSLVPDALLGYNKTNAYGLLEFDTTQADPVVTYRIMTLDDREIHRLSIYRSQLE